MTSCHSFLTAFLSFLSLLVLVIASYRFWILVFSPLRPSSLSFFYRYPLIFQLVSRHPLSSFHRWLTRLLLPYHLLPYHRFFHHAWYLSLPWLALFSSLLLSYSVLFLPTSWLVLFSWVVFLTFLVISWVFYDLDVLTICIPSSLECIFIFYPDPIDTRTFIQALPSRNSPRSISFIIASMWLILTVRINHWQTHEIFWIAFILFDIVLVFLILLRCWLYRKPMLMSYSMINKLCALLCTYCLAWLRPIDLPFPSSTSNENLVLLHPLSVDTWLSLILVSTTAWPTTLGIHRPLSSHIPAWSYVVYRCRVLCTYRSFEDETIVRWVGCNGPFPMYCLFHVFWHVLILFYSIDLVFELRLCYIYVFWPWFCLFQTIFLIYFMSSYPCLAFPCIFLLHVHFGLDQTGRLYRSDRSDCTVLPLFGPDRSISFGHVCFGSRTGRLLVSDRSDQFNSASVN